MASERKQFRERLRDFLRECFEQTRVVVWRDPSGILGPVVREALPPVVTMPPAEGGNPLALRQVIDRDDPWLEGRWLLYVTGLPQGWDCTWLTDYERGFEALPQADLSWALSRFYSLVETPELRALLMTDAARELASRFDEYFPDAPATLTGEGVRQALLRAAVHEPHADDETLVLRYLVDDDARSRWDELRLLPLLTSVIRDRLGLRRHVTGGHAPDRHAVCRCMLAAAIREQTKLDAEGLSNHLPSPEHRGRWAKLLERGLSDPTHGPKLATVVQEAVEGASSKLLDALDDAEALAHGPPLDLIDRRMQRLLLDAHPADDTQRHAWWQEVASVATTREKQPGLSPSMKRRWSVVSAAADLLHEVAVRRGTLETTAVGDVDALASAYVARDGDHIVDRLYRKIPQASGDVPMGWEEKLVEPARREYHRFTMLQTERFVTAVERAGRYRAKGFMAHTAFWSTLAEPLKGTAVLCVDALRADLAWELVMRLERRKHKVASRPALAQLPTRTEVGMAALLPRAEQRFEVRVEGGALLPAVDGEAMPGVTERKKHYNAVLTAQGVKHRREQIETFLTNDAKLLAECAAGAVLPIGYTLDIDDNGDAAATLTWEVFERALDQCERFVDQCLKAGFERVVVGADHGFLVRDPNASPHAIQGTQQKGSGFTKTFRYAAGNGVVAPELVHLPATALGREGADVYVPRGTQCLGVQGGPPLFVHGGLSLQECALVFLSVTPGTTAQTKRAVPVTMEAPSKTTSLLVNVRVVAAGVDLPLNFAPVRVWVELRDETGKVATSDEVVWTPSTKEQSTSVLVKAPRGGTFRAALVDARGTLIQSTEVVVDVQGDSFDF